MDPVSLVHALQNHDELTYELVHWSTGHRDDIYEYKNEQVTGEQLGDIIRRDLSEKLTGPNAPYNRVFTTNGIACTTASLITATLGSPTWRNWTRWSTSTTSGAPTCCWQCSTPYNPASSRCPAGTSAGCSPSRRAGFGAAAQR